jgi:hypothetical protein
MYKYRVLTADRKIKFTGTVEGSWFTLDQARQKVNRELGEMIYQYNDNQERLFEVF